MAGEVERIKDRLTIAEVIGGYLKLEKAGSSLKAKCPFHNEKTPSFIVTPSRGTFYCFGCGAKGDVFTFVERYEGVEFRKALEMLAAKAGIELERVDPRKIAERELSLEILERATSWFSGELARSKDAFEYLTKRGLSEKTIGEWRLGFAPAEWEALRVSLKAKGYLDEDLFKAGLLRKSEKKKGEYYDYFRDRVIFPLMSPSGKVVGFSGRVFQQADDGPKYLNSPDSPLFHKSSLLYGFDRAKSSIHKFTFSIVVEGQMDLLLAHQSGWSNTVAPSGTALTAEHLSQLKGLSPNIVLAFDSDPAGVAAAGKAAYAALSMGMNVKIATFPVGKDPADMLVENEEAFRSAIRGSAHVIDFYLDHLSSEKLEERKFRLLVQQTVLPYLALIDNRIDQAHFVGRIAARLKLSEEPVWEELKKLKQTKNVKAPPAKAALKSPKKEIILRRLVSILLSQKEASNPAVDTEALESTIRRIAPTDVARILSAPSEELQVLRIEGEGVPLTEEVEELLLNLEEQIVRDELADLLATLRVLEEMKEGGKSEELMKRSKELSEKINHLTTLRHGQEK